MESSFVWKAARHAHFACHEFYASANSRTALFAFLRKLPRDFIGHIKELRAGLRISLMDRHLEYVIVGFIALNFILLAMMAAAGLFTVDAVFVLVLLQLAATAALLANSES